MKDACLVAWVVHESKHILKIQVLSLKSSRYLRVTIEGSLSEAVIFPGFGFMRTVYLSPLSGEVNHYTNSLQQFLALIFEIDNSQPIIVTQ